MKKRLIGVLRNFGEKFFRFSKWLEDGTYPDKTKSMIWGYITYKH